MSTPQTAQIIPYLPTMKVVNVESLPKCKMAPYLEVIPSHIDGVWIAKAWRRKVTKTGILLEFSKKK